jgi:hypothetical protein
VLTSTGWFWFDGRGSRRNLHALSRCCPAWNLEASLSSFSFRVLLSVWVWQLRKESTRVGA